MRKSGEERGRAQALDPERAPLTTLSARKRSKDPLEERVLDRKRQASYILRIGRTIRT